MASLTDYELGKQHAKLGLECKYPNNINYCNGFDAGTVVYMRELKAEKPFASNLPDGTNDYIGE